MHADSVAQLTRMVVEYEHNLMPSSGKQESGSLYGSIRRRSHVSLHSTP